MSTSFLRAAKRKTRSEACLFVGENLEDLSRSILPSKSDIIRNINHRRELLSKVQLSKSDWSILFKDVTADVISIWQRGCIPVGVDHNIEDQITKFTQT